jgi:farnesyl-diphosphate farnesyltransferase
LEWVWSRILEGQVFDLERFGDGVGEVGLTGEELDRYAYLVAGCVGEFWTELSFERVPRFSRAERGEMIRLGVEYGKGLQRVNILRDRVADRGIGRVYVADADFERVKDEARLGLEAGVEWARRVERRRMRVACALPARVGLAMWPELRVDAVAGVKISRARLRGLVARGLVGVFR